MSLNLDHQVNEIFFTVLLGKQGDIGFVLLNRQRQLNALNQAMSIALRAQLLQWAQLDNIKAVVICGAGDKAFCAGGDIRDIYALRDTPHAARVFFAHEYRLNHTIYHFQKPYIALLNGLTMGGGLGISVNGKYRIATEKLKLAMPETGIGFFTDVGASYFLSRCPSKIGWYLGLTGITVNAADAQQAGLVDTVINSQDIPLLLTRLAEAVWSEDLHSTVKQVVQSLKGHSQPASLKMREIESCFSEPSVELILAALDQTSDPWCQQTSQLLRTRSPISLKVVLEQLKRGAQLSLDECLRMEYRIAGHFLETPDFYEGVRAAIIDKDRSPHWHPKSLEEISESKVAAYFVPLDGVEDLSFL